MHLMQVTTFRVNFKNSQCYSYISLFWFNPLLFTSAPQVFIQFSTKFGGKNNGEIEIIGKEGLKGSKAGRKRDTRQEFEPKETKDIKEVKEQGQSDSRMKSPFRIDSEEEMNKRKYTNYGGPQRVEFIPY